PPEMRIREPLLAHLADVGAVELHAELPAEWLTIRERWAALVGSAFECRNRLATSIVKGNGDTAALYAQALAETTANAEAEQEVRRAVGASVLAALKGHYAPIASVVYKRVAALFDQAAQERDDYQLDQMLIVLCAAARLCGATPDIAPHATAKLGLT